MIVRQHSNWFHHRTGKLKKENAEKDLTSIIIIIEAKSLLEKAISPQIITMGWLLKYPG